MPAAASSSVVAATASFSSSSIIATMSLQDQAEMARKMQDYEALKAIITQWNANRLDLFELSLPNEQLEFHGVMRFYYQSQDSGFTGQKVATKCIRVSSTATTKAIIETLIEKFRPDMRMLEVPEYALYEIHESGERRLNPEEKPLLVQLNWHKDDREGRFLLRRIDEMSRMPEVTKEDTSFKRKLSKREKKQLKKQEKLNKLKDKENNKDEGVAEKLYTELPDTSFTRSISNPEAVMRRRRQQKLEKKLQQFRSKDGGPDTGGTLKIYGEALCRDVPYKTLLLSITDTAAFVVEEMLEKYGLDRKEAVNYCLIQAGGGDNGTMTREYYLEDDECPLAILMNHPPSRGAVTFHVVSKPPDFQPRKRKKRPTTSENIEERLPYLLEVNPNGSEITGSGVPFRYRLPLNVTEVGSDPAIGGGQALLLPASPYLHLRHCVIAHTEGIVTVTPSHREAETFVNNQRIYETTILQHGCFVRFGRSHCFRFIDPMHEERIRYQTSTSTLPDQYQVNSNSNYVHYESQQQPPPPPPQPQYPQQVQQHHQQMQQQQRMGKDNILPAVLEFREETEEAFFNAITIGLDVNTVQFKLAPTYTIYMATRFRASTHYRPELVPEERAIRLTDMLNRVSNRIFTIAQIHSREANVLAFWMANASELLHFLKSDRHITAFSLKAQDTLAEAVHMSFKQLVICLQADLEMVMPQTLTPPETNDDDDQNTAEIMQVLSSAMSLLRKCRVNAALTIQLFSQLFHFINMWTFNQVVMSGYTKTINYCTHKWGFTLKKRIAKVEQWAEKQGLELAADCHLARIVQAAHLLMARKNTAEDIASVSSICFKLNSLQLKTLLNKYEPAPDENPISNEMIDTIVRVAENTVDESTNAEGREVRLEEDFVLQLPFLLPEDGYSCDIVRGVPGGLTEFLAPMQRVGLCVMTPQPTSSGLWTIYMETTTPVTPIPPRSSPSEMSLMNGVGQVEPEVQTIQLIKSNSGMGLSIVAAKGVGKDKLGIYIKAVVEGGAAYHDGRLQAGDQLLKVDGQSLVGITQERAAEIMMHTGQVVELEVAKQGAIYHGLATLLSQPSPLMPRQQPPPPQSKMIDHHTYQNHKPSGPPPSRGVIQHHPNRSTSIQNLHLGGGGGGGPPPVQRMGQRQASIPVLATNPRQQQMYTSNEEQSYYQNIGSSNGGQFPVRNNRYDSQSSLLQQPSPLGGSRPLSTAIYGDRFPPPDELLHHATPRLVGTPMASYPRPPNARGGQQSQPISSPPGGPEKPQRQYAYAEEPQHTPPARSVHFGGEQQQQTTPVRIVQQTNNNGSTTTTANTNRVRFLEPQVEDQEEQANREVEEETETVGSQLENLRLSSVEREFRRRIAEYNKEDDSGSDGDDRRLVNGGASRQEQERLRKVEEVERKQKELEETKKVEDRFLQEAQKRRKNNNKEESPPPLPSVPPPVVAATSSTTSTTSSTTAVVSSSSGAQRLDMLIGNGPVNNNGGVLKSNGKADTPTKKVSFITEEKDDSYDDNANNLHEDKLSKLERVKDNPEAFINEAESLMNSSMLTLERFDYNKSTGHTPSVIGAQEVYRDPRMKRLQKEQEEKAAIKARDGAKLSFKEKMKLFAVEAGESTPKEKAKISKAQREIDGELEAEEREKRQ